MWRPALAVLSLMPGAHPRWVTARPLKAEQTRPRFGTGHPR